MKKILSIILVLVLSVGCFSIVSFAEETDTAEHLTEVPEGYVGVYTKNDLFAVRENPSQKYILMNDIVFEDKDYVKGGDFYNSGTGWEPIGTSSTPFKGIFDGNNYTIYNLYINAPQESYQGLFGYVVDAKIYNIYLLDIDFIGGSRVGGICGYIYKNTTIEKCNVSGRIEGNNYVGGIIGEQYCFANEGINGTNYTSCIKRCTNLADVKGIYYVGGICGSVRSYYYYNNSQGHRYKGYAYIALCQNAGNITATSYAGGIAGEIRGDEIMYSEIYNCFNNGDSSSGGIVGYSTTAKISYCYSANKAFASKPCVGNADDTNLVFCYYMSDSGESNSTSSGIAKSEDQLRKKGTYEQWNFATVWTMEGREDYPYPELRNVPLILPSDSEHKHEYTSEITTPATHTKAGIMTYTCDCGDTYTEDIEKIADHSYNTVVTKPTCIEKGYTTYICECNDSYITDYVDAKGHDFKSTITYPTCTEHGYTTYICVCGETFTRDYTSATNHIDNNTDYKCDYGCGYEFEKPADPTPDEPTNQTFIQKIISWFKNLINKLFGWPKR